MSISVDGTITPNFFANVSTASTLVIDPSTSIMYAIGFWHIDSVSTSGVVNANLVTGMATTYSMTIGADGFIYIPCEQTNILYKYVPDSGVITAFGSAV
jgi:hypothetical protein